MKHLKEIIQEKLKINSKSNTFGYTPKTKEELEEIIIKLIEQHGNKADLNDIDISKVYDLTYLFSKYDKNGHNKENNLYKFNGDISNWDVSKVENMEGMFYCSKFNGNISKWNVNKVTNMQSMFAHSNFNKDISKWNVSNVEDMSHMFADTKFNQDISKWDVSNVKEFGWMFEWDEDFDQDLNKWNVTIKAGHVTDMFVGTKLSNLDKLPEWYKKIKSNTKRTISI